MAGAALPTRWVLPEHLLTAEERGATRSDVRAELPQTFQARPPVIVAPGTPGALLPNPAASQLLRKDTGS